MTDSTSGIGDGRRSVWRIAGWSAAVLLLALPAVAMQVTDEVRWGVGDFAAAAAVLGTVGVLVEVAVRATSDRAYRAAVGVALGAAALLVWIIAAVGLLGAAGDAADWMYAGVLGVGAAGAALARFRARGMALALLATAVSQGAVAGVALAGGMVAPASSALEVLALNGSFAVLGAGSALLFRAAARDRAREPGGA